MKRKLLSLAVILTATFGLNAQITNYSVGQTVADFTVTDVHGNSHTLSTYTNAGKWVVLDFFFVACGPCQATVPYFSELHEKYGCNEGDLVCISVDTGDDDAAVLGFEAQYSVSTGFSPAPAASGTEGGGQAVVDAYGPSQYPTYCLIGADMTLKNGDIWPISSVADFENAITAAGHNPTPMSCAGGGVAENTAGISSLAVFPNPAANNTTVSVNLEATAEVTVKVYNLVGAIVSNQVFAGTDGENNFEINTSDLENGQYILSVSLGDDVAQSQINLNILK